MRPTGLKNNRSLLYLVQEYTRDTGERAPLLEEIVDLKKVQADRARKRYDNDFDVRHKAKVRVARWRAKKRAERDAALERDPE